MRKLAFVLLSISVLAGCGPSDEEKPVTATAEKLYSEPTGWAFDSLAEDAVIVTVDGHTLTKRDILENAEMNLALRLHKNPALTPRDQKRNRMLFYRYYPEEFIRQTLIATYAATNAIVLDDATMEMFKKRAYRVMRAKGDKKLDDILAADGVDAELVEARIRSEALEHKVKKMYITANPLVLDPAWADQKIKGFHDYNARMVLTNALIYARATNVWQQLKSGADFRTVAKKYTELDKERADNCEWGAHDVDFLKDDFQLLTEIKKLQPGQFTPPVEGDNGLMIAYLDGFDEDGAYKLSRIFFHLPLFYEIPTKEELIESANDDHAKKIYIELGKNLRKNAIIIFPNGETLFTKEAK